MSKISNLLPSDVFFQALLNVPKPVFVRGSSSDRVGGAYDAPPDPLAGGNWTPPPTLRLRRLRRLDLSILAPPTQNSCLRLCYVACSEQYVLQSSD